MAVVKTLAMIFLAIYLIITPLCMTIGISISGVLGVLLGLCALASGVLMLISCREWLHYSDEV